MHDEQSFKSFIGWGFQALILAVGTWGVAELAELSKSVQELNIKMAVVVERDLARGAEIQDLKGRVNRLEQGH